MKNSRHATHPDEAFPEGCDEEPAPPVGDYSSHPMLANGQKFGSMGSLLSEHREAQLHSDMEAWLANRRPDNGNGSFEDLEAWLSGTVRANTDLVAARVQRAVQDHLEEHQKTLVSVVVTRLRGESCLLERAGAPGGQGGEPSGSDGLPGHLGGGSSSVKEVKSSPVVLFASHPATSEDGSYDAVGVSTGGGSALKAKGEPFSLLTQSSIPQFASRFPSAMHTHHKVELHPHMATSLDELKKSVSAMKLNKQKEYKSKILQEMAGQTAKDPSAAGHNKFERFVRSNRFEYLSVAMIFCCTATMIMEIEYNGFVSGYNLEAVTFTVPGKERWPGAETIFLVSNHVYNVLFLTELVMRVLTLRKESLKSGWIWFDFVLVTCGWLDAFKMLEFGLDPMILRVLRLARMLRLLKVLKAIRAFETLFLLVRSLQSSVGALFWSFALLWSAQVVAGILLCQMLREYIDNDDIDKATRREVFLYFGTFSHATITMFEITLSNWVSVCRLLYTNVSPWYAVFFILYRGCFMFAVIKVITAVFLAETARCASSDDNMAVQKKQKQKEVYCRKLHEIFSELDESGDGFLTSEEFRPLITDELLKTWLATLEVDTQDLDKLFDILDDGDGRIDLAEFTHGMTRIRGPAKSIDVLKLQTSAVSMSAKIDALERVLVNLAQLEKGCVPELILFDAELPEESLERTPEMQSSSASRHPLTHKYEDVDELTAAVHSSRGVRLEIPDHHGTI